MSYRTTTAHTHISWLNRMQLPKQNNQITFCHGAKSDSQATQPNADQKASQPTCKLPLHKLIIQMCTLEWLNKRRMCVYVCVCVCGPLH